MKEEIEIWGRIPESMMKDKRLNKNDIIVYSYLSMIQGNKHNSFRYIKDIAGELNLYRTSVDRSISNLKKYNWLVTTKRGSGNSSIFSVKIQKYNPSFEQKSSKRGQHLKKSTLNVPSDEEHS